MCEYAQTHECVGVYEYAQMHEYACGDQKTASDSLQTGLRTKLQFFARVASAFNHWATLESRSHRYLNRLLPPNSWLVIFNIQCVCWCLTNGDHKSTKVFLWSLFNINTLGYLITKCCFPVLVFENGLLSFDLTLTPAPTYFSLLRVSL